MELSSVFTPGHSSWKETRNSHDHISSLAYRLPCVKSAPQYTLQDIHACQQCSERWMVISQVFKRGKQWLRKKKGKFNIYRLFDIPSRRLPSPIHQISQATPAYMWELTLSHSLDILITCIIRISHKNVCTIPLPHTHNSVPCSIFIEIINHINYPWNLRHVKYLDLIVGLSQGMHPE